MAAPRSTRGTEDRGTGAQRERNVTRAGVHATVPEQTYDIRGFDIGSSDLSKADIRKQLEPAVQQIHARMGQCVRPGDRTLMMPPAELRTGEA
jgi:hypothetical protein